MKVPCQRGGVRFGPEDLADALAMDRGAHVHGQHLEEGSHTRPDGAQIDGLPPISKRNGPRSRSAAGGRGAATSPGPLATPLSRSRTVSFGVGRRHGERHPQGMLVPQVFEPARGVGLVSPSSRVHERHDRLQGGHRHGARLDPGAADELGASLVSSLRSVQGFQGRGPGLQDRGAKPDGSVRGQRHRHAGVGASSRTPTVGTTTPEIAPRTGQGRQGSAPVVPRRARYLSQACGLLEVVRAPAQGQQRAAHACQPLPAQALGGADGAVEVHDAVDVVAGHEATDPAQSERRRR